MCISLSVVDPLISPKIKYLFLKIISFPKYFKVYLAIIDVINPIIYGKNFEWIHDACMADISAFFLLFNTGTY